MHPMLIASAAKSCPLPGPPVDHSVLEEEPLGWDQAPTDPEALPLERHTPVERSTQE